MTIDRKPFGKLEWSDVVPDLSNPVEMILWELAQKMSQAMAEKKAMEEAFDVKDISFVAGKAPVTREPEYFISPYDGATLRVKVIEIPDPDLEGETRLVRQWVIIRELKCPRCEREVDMFGWELDAPEGQVNRVVQCPNCGMFHWLTVGVVDAKS